MSRRLRWVLGGVGLVLFLVLGAQALVKEPSEWLQVYVAAARELAAGRDIYAPHLAYLYPPFMAFATLPLAWLPPLPSRAVWYVLSAVCTVGMPVFAWRAAGGVSVAAAIDDRRERWAVLIGVLCAITYILNTLAHQQTDLIIGFLLMLGCWLLVAQRDAPAGMALGLAAACKATPALFVAYLLWRRRWLAAAVMTATGIAATLATQAIASPANGGLWVTEWLSRYVFPTQQLAAPLGLWGSDLVYNQSLGGTLQRWFGGQGGVVLKLTAYAILAMMMAVTLAASTRTRNEEIAGGVPRTAIECSAILMLMLLASPMSSPAHFVTLILPGFCLARLAFVSGDRISATLVVAAAVLSVATNKDPLGDWLYGRALWVGTIAMSAAFLWVGCIGVLARRPHVATSLSAQPS